MLNFSLKFCLDHFDECEEYSLTSTLESEHEASFLEKRNIKKKRLPDFTSPGESSNEDEEEENAGTNYIKRSQKSY